MVLRAPNYGMYRSLSVMRLSAAGAPVWAEVPVAAGNNLLSPSLAAQGSDAIVAWVDAHQFPSGYSNLDPPDQRRLSLARVRLAP